MHNKIAGSLSIITVALLAATAVHGEPFTLASTVPQTSSAITLDGPPIPVTSDGPTTPFRWMHLQLESDTPTAACPSLSEPGRYAIRLDVPFGVAYSDLGTRPTSIAEYVSRGRGHEDNIARTARNHRKGSRKARFDIGYHNSTTPQAHRTGHDS